MPVSGATVLVIWWGGAAGATESHTKCVHAEITTTDAAGRYKIEGWFGLWYGKYLMLSDANAAHIAYKLGYRSLMNIDQSKADIPLEPFTGTKDEWFHEMRNGLVACFGPPDEAQSKLAEFYNAIAADMESFAETVEQRQVAKNLRNRAKLNLPGWHPGGDSNTPPTRGN